MNDITQQLEMPFFQLLAKTKMLNAYLVSKCQSESDALLLCWNQRRTKHTLTRASEILGIPKSHLSNILNGKKYPPYDMRVAFQILCGNWAIRQFEDYVIGAETKFETPEQQEIKRLRAQIEAQKAA
jgi:hypothetical protein